MNRSYLSAGDTSIDLPILESQRYLFKVSASNSAGEGNSSQELPFFNPTTPVAIG